MPSAASPTRRRYGNITRVSWTASASWAGSDVKPGAIARSSQGASAMPSSVVTVSVARAAPSVARTRRCSSSRERTAAYSVNTGMTAVDSAPSASSRRRTFGMR